VDEIHKFFEKRNWHIRIDERRVPMSIHKLDMQQWTLQTTGTTTPHTKFATGYPLPKKSCRVQRPCFGQRTH
jgi:hypothetical protein